MWTRIGLALGLLLCGVAPALADGFVETSGTYSEGAQLRGFRFDTNGALKVTQATLFSGEDQTNNVMRVEGQFSYSGNKTADTQIKASAGYVHNLVCIGTDAAATAGTIILYDNTAESGTVVLSWAVQATAYAQPVVFPLDVAMTTGIYLGFTTTADVTCTVSYR
jgi:hypothetical protein